MFSLVSFIENLRLVVISYEIFLSESLASFINFNEMTTSVRFCLSYDPLKWDFMAREMKLFQ